MSGFEDFTGRKFEHWTVLEELGKGKILCQCDCENHTIRELYKKAVKNGQTKSCGCARINKLPDEVIKQNNLQQNDIHLNENSNRGIIQDLTGLKFWHWTVLDELGNGRVLCQCDCVNKTVKNISKSTLKSGKTRSCGCAEIKDLKDEIIEQNNISEDQQKIIYSGVKRCEDTPDSIKQDLTGLKFWHWTILKELGGKKVLCKCDCEDNTVRVLNKSSVKNGYTKSCGCARKKVKTEDDEIKVKKDKINYVGNHYGEWEVLEYIKGTGRVLCRCSCGTEKTLYLSHLLDGTSKSCGCKSREFKKETMIEKYGDTNCRVVDKPREKWQQEILENENNFKNYLRSFDVKLTATEVANNLSSGYVTILRYIEKFKAREYVKLDQHKSEVEEELFRYIENNTELRVMHKDKEIIKPYELDIYIPDKKIAFEFNGDYWHSSVYKSKDYHQLKSIMCMQNGVRLIHVFEYEWRSCKDKEYSVKDFIDDLLHDRCRIYARECIVTETNDIREVKEFENENHIQGYTYSDINIKLAYNNEIVGIMTFGKPRFGGLYNYEMIRLCFKKGYSVIGGTEKMFKYARDIMGVNNIVSYCDISKFNGKVYDKLGFKLVEITQPGYVWVKHNNYTIVDVVSRYNAQKHKLVQKGLGSDDMTEDEIMMNNNYFKIYNSGNMKWVYNK